MEARQTPRQPKDLTAFGAFRYPALRVAARPTTNTDLGN
jgi:hypothetical protein